MKTIIMKSVLLSAFVWTFFISGSVNAQNNEIKLWPSFAPGTEKKENNEKWDDAGKQLYGVYQPRLIPFLPETSGTSVPAIIICPGGGYNNLTVEKEGTKIARWLNEHGIAAFVLLYRLDFHEALQDAQRALSLLRAESDRYHIDKNKIGIMGFSAGANVAANLATHFQKTNLRDRIDSVSSRPDFLIGVYGKYEPTGKSKEFNPNFYSYQPFKQSVTKNTPPTFLIQAGDDPRAPIQQCVNFYEALKIHNVPAELHIYEQGGHGFALEEGRGYAITSTVHSWSERCIEWLKVRGIFAQKNNF
jgi:acetyl esterase/lipase